MRGRGGNHKSKKKNTEIFTSLLKAVSAQDSLKSPGPQMQGDSTTIANHSLQASTSTWEEDWGQEQSKALGVSAVQVSKTCQD